MALTRNTYQRNSTWNAPYTFSGKEKDAETGYGYFGARYYDSGLSIWLSVDPMSDKYPSMSPYNYCANNPVILVDPDGREFIYVGQDESGSVDGGPDKPLKAGGSVVNYTVVESDGGYSPPREDKDQDKNKQTKTEPNWNSIVEYEKNTIMMNASVKKLKMNHKGLIFFVHFV